MEINNIKHDQQANTKLKRKLIHRMTPQEACDYELAYAEYNLIHANLCEILSEIQGEKGNHKSKNLILEII